MHWQSKNKGALYGGDLYWPTGLDVEKTGLVRIGQIGVHCVWVRVCPHSHPCVHTHTNRGDQFTLERECMYAVSILPG